eukprot:138569-Hanusia_phi.AAC.2
MMTPRFAIRRASCGLSEEQVREQPVGTEASNSRRVGHKRKTSAVEHIVCSLDHLAREDLGDTILCHLLVALPSSSTFPNLLRTGRSSDAISCEGERRRT